MNIQNYCYLIEKSRAELTDKETASEDLLNDMISNNGVVPVTTCRQTGSLKNTKFLVTLSVLITLLANIFNF